MHFAGTPNQLVRVSEGLAIVNSFSQMDYGNPRRTGRVYTDVDALVANIAAVVDAHPGERVYIPHGIGAGFGGASWDDIASKLRNVDCIAVRLPG